MRVTSVFIVMLAVGLMSSPWIFGYSHISGAATAEAIVAGLTLAALGLWGLSLRAPARLIDGAHALVGLWVLSAPWILDYAWLAAARNSHLTVGIFVATLGVASIMRDRPAAVV